MSISPFLASVIAEVAQEVLNDVTPILKERITHSLHQAIGSDQRLNRQDLLAQGADDEKPEGSSQVPS
jgi:hypothetical protein